MNKIIQEEVLKLTAEVWNKVIDIPNSEMHPDDINDIRYHIHAIQNIIYSQLYINKHGKI